MPPIAVVKYRHSTFPEPMEQELELSVQKIDGAGGGTRTRTPPTPVVIYLGRSLGRRFQSYLLHYQQLTPVESRHYDR